jgi:hypothetical protein
MARGALRGDREGRGIGKVQALKKVAVEGVV